MTGQNIVGIVFSNAYDECLPELTGLRTMGSVPFAGRYRLIDFALSNMVNADIEKVGVITKSNYQSLMDHLGTGKPWDLSRKTEGMFLLPPFSTAEQGSNVDKIASLKGAMGFISRSNEEYVLFADCNTVFNADVREFMAFHTEKDADITILYKHGHSPALHDAMIMDVESDGRVSKVSFAPSGAENVNYSLNMILMKKSLLERLMNEAISQNLTDFEADIIQKNTDRLKIYGLEFKDFAVTIDSMASYFKANMSLLEPDNCLNLFNSERPVYTKLKDDMPATYGIGSDVKNSLVANGCIIEGEVENSIIFRGVRIEKGAIVKNSIVMQDTYIAQNSIINCIIADKNVVVTPNKTLSGVENYPVYIGKGIVI